MIWLGLAALALACAAGFTAWFPLAGTALWIMVVETTPELWLPGAHETLIGAVKAAGIALAVIIALRFGWRRDRYNPAFAYTAMFATGLLHGLYPGLTILSSLRSLIGSAAPFAFSFIKLPADFRPTVTRIVILGPLANLAAGLILNALHLHPIYTMEAGVLRLAGAGQPAFLGGFALIAIYAGLMEIIRDQHPRSPRTEFLLLATNFAILLLTGARTPLALAALLLLGTLLFQRRLMALAAAIALLAIAILFQGDFGFIRAVSLVQLGQAENLSNRNLIWPLFESAIASSPWVGWGVGAGKIIVPTTTGISTLIGTNAAHNEYLRIGCEGGLIGAALLIVCMALWAYHGSKHLPRAERTLIRLVFLAFAVHSATDNTLIATTSSVLFIWASAIFSTAATPPEEAPECSPAAPPLPSLSSA